MKNVAFCAVFISAAGLFSLQVQATPLPQYLRTTLPDMQLSGQATLAFWGFDVYQATLWVAPGFVDTAYEQSRLALELAYLRDFKGADIAKRSMAEMRRQTPLTPAQESAWDSQMRALFPDVKAGDRITGVHQPGSRTVFWRNGRILGEVNDPAFAKPFFGIWLAPQTSEPLLRWALLGRVSPRTPDAAAR